MSLETQLQDTIDGERAELKRLKQALADAWPQFFLNENFVTPELVKKIGKDYTRLFTEKWGPKE